MTKAIIWLVAGWGSTKGRPRPTYGSAYTEGAGLRPIFHAIISTMIWTIIFNCSTPLLSIFVHNAQYNSNNSYMSARKRAPILVHMIILSYIQVLFIKCGCGRVCMWRWLCWWVGWKLRWRHVRIHCIISWYSEYVAHMDNRFYFW